MHNLFIGSHVINISGLSEEELVVLQRNLETALDDVDEMLNRGSEEDDFHESRLQQSEHVNAKKTTAAERRA